MLSCRFASFCALLAVASACGESASDPAPTREGSDAVQMTVLVPRIYDEEYSVELLITRADDETSLPTQPVAVQSQGSSVTYGDGPADVWTAGLDLEPGEYTFTFRCWTDGEILCVASKEFKVAPETVELYAVLTFVPECNRIDFADPTSGPKSSCFSDTGLLLSAEIPESVESVVSMRYLLSPTNLDAVWEPLHGGALEPAGNSLADFGQGPVLTDRWEATFGVLVYHPGPYALEVTAVDERGDSVCRLNATVELPYGELHRFHYVMPCSP